MSIATFAAWGFE